LIEASRAAVQPNARPGRVQAPPAFECQGVSLQFDSATGPHRVFDDLSFDVAPGEFVSIVGQSSTGKSMLLRVLGGLERAEPTQVQRRGGLISNAQRSFDAATAFGILAIVGGALGIAINVVVTAAEGWFLRYRPHG
jgi:ABC-type glutathione transport system ATPase component